MSKICFLLSIILHFWLIFLLPQKEARVSFSESSPVFMTIDEALPSLPSIQKLQKIQQQVKQTKDFSPKKIAKKKKAALKEQTSLVSTERHDTKNAKSIDSEEGELPVFSHPQEKMFLVNGFRKPIYPRKAQLKNQEGTVKIKVSIDQGHQKEMKIAQSSGFKDLDEAALKAMKSWVFKSEISLEFYQEISFVLR